ncbi:hypothetical protein SEEN176_21059 [Salmonella enterica subsp. enterica serovar Newport str. CVM 4176]|nr:hypothetical protein SEEN176_21059 [Salmonella enterica subsp. enterica serovar Newport str. CVM 4176]
MFFSLVLKAGIQLSSCGFRIKDVVSGRALHGALHG